MVQTVCDRLAEKGIVVSFAFGSSEQLIGKCIWSVQVLTENGDEFFKPFAARSIQHAAEIAEIECRKRGWIE